MSFYLILLTIYNIWAYDMCTKLRKNFIFLIKSLSLVIN